MLYVLNSGFIAAFAGALCLFQIRKLRASDAHCGIVLIACHAVMLLALQQLLVSLAGLTGQHLLEAIVIAMMMIGVAALETANFAARLYFGHGMAMLICHLPYSSANRPSPRMVATYVKQYFPKSCFIFILVCLSGGAALQMRFGAMTMTAAVVALLVMLAAMLPPKFYRRRRRGFEILPGEVNILGKGRPLHASALYHARRSQNIVASGPVRYAPETIILIINESAGRNLPSSDGATTLIARLLELSGDAQDWVIPSNAVSNSSCTDVSLPSILTGCGAHETRGKLHTLPFVFDLAKARGYETLFFTSTTLNWAGFDSFLGAADVDELFTAESANAPLINDLTIDDMLVARALADKIRQRSGKLLAVLYCNSLHVPYQTQSVIEIPSSLRDRRSRGLHILESVHGEIFSALHQSGRYDDALMFLIGDHGDIDHSATSANTGYAARLTELTDDVIYPLFMVKPPRHIPETLRQTLIGNGKALIANLDIAPSIAGLLGLACVGETYAGQNLFEPISEHRLAFACNVNEWRSWPRGAAGVFQGTTKLVADYQDRMLTRFSSLASTPEHSRAGHEALLALVLNDDIMTGVLARILKDKLVQA